MEAAGEGVLLVALAHQAQAAGTLVLLGAQVLDVHLAGGTGECAPAASAPPPRPSLGPSPTHLAGLQAQLDLHLACLRPHPHVDLWGQRERWPPGLRIPIRGRQGSPGQGRGALTSWPLSKSMMSSSAKSSWQKSEHFSVTAK